MHLCGLSFVGLFSATFSYTSFVVVICRPVQCSFGYTSFGRPSPKFLHPPVSEHKLLASGMTLEDIPSKMVGLRIQHEVPNVHETLVYGKQKLVVDAACFMGRSFRVGWGPNWTLVHSGFPCMAEAEGEMCFLNCWLILVGMTVALLIMTHSLPLFC